MLTITTYYSRLFDITVQITSSSDISYLKSRENRTQQPSHLPNIKQYAFRKQRKLIN
jgi:hypothetical protein